MSYKFYSLTSGNDNDLLQWGSRTLDGELEAFESRTLRFIFDKYLRGTKCKVLEGGCGLGAWCEWFNRRGHEAVGLEYDPRVIEAARVFKPEVSVKLGNILEIDYPTNSFDVYVSLGVFEHLENGPEQALLEARRILKPDGLAFITTPYLSPLRRLIYHPIREGALFIARIMGKETYFWEYRFTEEELVDFIREAGFEILEVAVDDYPGTEKRRHLGLYADWFFFRKRDGGIWELNFLGKTVRTLLRVFPDKWYCSGIVVVARPRGGSNRG